MSWLSKKGGGGTVDTVARGQASAASGKVDNIVKNPGDTVKAGSTVFVNLSDGTTGSYSNKTAADITIPATATDTSLKTAGLVLAIGSATDSRVNAIYKVAGDKVSAGSEVFIALASGSVVNYRNPTVGDLIVPASPDNTSVLAAGFAPIAAKENHLHSILASSATLAGSDTIFKVSGGKLWKNKVANPNITITSVDSGWSTDWEEAIPATTGLTYVTVKDNDTLVAKQFSVAETAVNVVTHLTAPPVTANSWYSVINAGKGIVDVNSVQIIGEGALEFTANKAGTAWVLTSREGTITPSSEKTSKTFTQTAHGFKVGQAVYHDGTKFALADSTTEAKSEVVGIVSAVNSADSFDLCSEGYITGIVQTGLSAGVVFLNGTPGNLTTTPPTTGFLKAVMLLDSATSGWVLHRPGFDLSASSASTEVLDAWLPSTHANHSTKGIVSFSQIKAAILEEYKFYNTGTWNANDAYKSLNQFVAGSSGVSVNGFPGGLNSPQSFISEFYGDSVNGEQRLQIFGPPAATRGIWSRQRSASNWTPWQREAFNNWQYTASPAIQGDVRLVEEGDNIVCNDGDKLELSVANSVMGCMVCPATDWANVPTIKVSAAAALAGWTIVGTQPTSGTEAIHLIPGTFDKSWNIKKTSASSVALKTIHDLGKASAIALKSADNDAEAHLEGGSGYSIEATDCADGNRFRLINTGGTNYTAAVSFTGFSAVYERVNGTSTAVGGGANTTTVVGFFFFNPLDAGDHLEIDSLIIDATGTELPATAIEGAYNSGAPGDAVNFTLGNITVTGTIPTGWRVTAGGDDILFVNALADGPTPAPTITDNFGGTKYTANTQLGTIATGSILALKAHDWRDIYITNNGGSWYANITGGNQAANEPTKGTTANFTTSDTDYRVGKFWDGETLSTQFANAANLADLLGVAIDDANLGAFTGETIPDDVTIKAAFQALETKLETYKVTGRYVGSASTYATLPTTSTATGDAINGDWVALNADEVGTGTAVAPQYPKGVYIYDGSKYTFAFALASAIVELTKTQAETGTDTTFGLVSGERLAQAIDNRTLKPYLFASKASVTVAKSNFPTIDEITTWINAQTTVPRDQFVYYTSTNTSTDTASHIWFVDKDGKVLSVLAPGDATIKAWMPDEIVEARSLRSTMFGSAYCIMINDTSKSTTGAVFDATEAGSWRVISQSYIGTFSELAPYGFAPHDFRIKVNNQVYRKKTGGAVGTVFDATEKLKWDLDSGVYVPKTATGTSGNLTGNCVWIFKAGTPTSIAISTNQYDSFFVRNSDGRSYTITNPAGETVNGGTSVVTITTGELLFFNKDGTNWYVNRINNTSDSIQNIGATGNVTAWESIVVISATADMTLTLPTCANSNGKKITLVRVDNTAFKVTLAAQAAQTVTLTNNGTELNRQNCALTVEVISATASQQVSNSTKFSAPTLHDLSAAAITPLTSTNTGSECHFEGGLGYSIDANASTDGDVYYLLNTAGSDQTGKLTFSNFAGAYLRSGGNEITITSPFTIPKGVKFMASVTVNGGSRFLNLAQLGGVVSGSVTCQSGSHAFNNIGTGLSGVFSVTFPQPFVNIPTVELTYQWNYNASTNGSALSPPLLVEGITTTGFSYRINGGRNTLDRVLWTAVDPQSTIQAGNQVLTPRAITGSVTSVGYDGVELPYKINLAAGLVLDTVSLNGTATTNFDANTGIVRISPNGAPVAVTHTTRAGATYNGLQRAMVSTTELAVTAANQTYTLPAVLMEGDLLEVQHQFNGNAAERQSVWVRVQAGSSQRNFPWPDATNNIHYWTFPATLDATFQVRQSTASSSPRILSVKVWRDAANGFAVPSASTVLTPRNITGSITSTGYDGVDLPYQITLPVGQVLDTITVTGGTVASSIQVANAGYIKIKPQGADVVVSHTTKAGATYQGMQVVASQSGLATAIGSSAVNVNFGVTLQTGDRITIHGDYANDANQSYTFVLGYVRPNTTTRAYCYPAANHDLIFNLPATLTDTVPLIHGGGNTSFRMRAFIIERNAANGYCIPTGYSVGKTYNLTVNGGTNGTFTGFEGIGPQPFILTGIPANQEVDVFPVVAGVSLLNRQAGLFTVDRALNAGNLALTGITFRNLGVRSKYFGTADNQAGHAADTNGGHTFTQRYMTGNGITTANNSTFTLSGGIYRIRYSVTHHKAGLSWSARALFVDNAEVCSIYTGDDGSNWPGGGDLEWIVDCTSASHTVQMKRTASNGNGNVDCWLAIEREEGYAVPEGYVTRDTCILTAGSGTFSSGATTANIPTNTGQYVGFTVPNGQVLQSVASNNANVIVGAADPKAGTVFITVSNGATAATLTPTFVATTARSAKLVFNAGVWATFGSLQFTMSTAGNRSFQVRSAAGSINVNIHSWTGWDAATSPFNVASLGTGSTQYLEPSYGYANSGNNQFFWVEDVTNNRRYEGVGTVGSAYNNNTLWIKEVT